MENQNKTINILDEKIDKLNLSNRARRCLLSSNIKTIGYLTNSTREELLLINNLGLTTIQEIQEKLKTYGLFLKEDRKIKELRCPHCRGILLINIYSK